MKLFLLPSSVLLSVAISVRAQGWGSGITEAGSWGSTIEPGWGATPTAANGAQPTSTDLSDITAPSGQQCTWHETHYDCESLETATEEEDSGDCIIHVGHHHGNCSPEQLASCDTTSVSNYNKPLHIGSIFIVFVTSALGVIIPLVSGRGRGTKADDAVGKGKGIMGEVFFVAKHFGTGIILSTAFIHLLYHGFIMFNNSCIGTLSYEATAPAIALAAAFLTFLLDFFGARHLDRKPPTSPDEDTISPSSSNLATRETKIPHTNLNAPDFMELGHSHHLCSNEEQKWQVAVLEAGIIFHSIMIGVTLGASGGNGWTTLLIVIVFHQFFEGLALGARIALLSFSSWWKPWAMGMAFILITPIGIAIGVGVHDGFAQNGKAALLSVGILNSISAGILLYAAFELLSTDFTSGGLKRAPIGRVLVALAALVSGMICMSVLGKWA